MRRRRPYKTGPTVDTWSRATFDDYTATPHA